MNTHSSESTVPQASPAPSSNPAGPNYKGTLNLPQTQFAMKADLVQNEPASLKRWAGMGVYERLRAARAGSPRFNFHDGPPYANGSIHLGHLMNKCLKDFVVRSKSMGGQDCPYIPGWDCHGLPIEHKVLTEMMENPDKAAKLRAQPEEQRRIIVRRECQKYAEKFHKLHTQQMTRLLTLADYEHPYLTMQPAYEAAVLEVLAGLLDKGLVYRALKPVHWSIANETALAEAELEYEDREDLSVYVDFEAADAGAVYDAFGLPPHADPDADDAPAGQDDGGDGSADDASAEDDDDGESGVPAAGVRPLVRPSFMIWTTTPWTLPANLAVAVNPRFEYALVWIDGNVTVLAANLVERVTKAAKAERVVTLATTTGGRLLGLRYRHPFVSVMAGSGSGPGRQQGGEGAAELIAARLGRSPVSDDDLGRVFSLVAADYVTLEDGTGLVHTAPGHGQEDYQTGLRESLPIYCPVRADGTYDATVPAWLRGLSIWDANSRIVSRLRESGHLFYDHAFTHSYPHDWRSKTPVIFRCTEQWFVAVDDPRFSLRAAALDATDPDPSRSRVAFFPEWGRNRMRGMLESRPDWCISRQRAWGLPIPAFALPGGSMFLTPASVRAVAAAVREKGSDLWFTAPPADLLKHYDPGSDPDAPAALKADPGIVASLRKGGDILDVWFESGSSWNAVLRQRNLGFPADLYLEGSDQHRGWFQLSLLPALGVTGSPPFKALLTHGFMVDKEGKKLSKSKGDTIDDLFARYGVDVLRWWVCSLSYENDVKVDDEFFALAGESYRKVRNTLRFMLSNLSDFDPSRASDLLVALPAAGLDAWAAAALDDVCSRVAAAYDRYEYRAVHSAVYDFCNETLSAVYLAAVKDRLYCDRPDSLRRRRTQAVLYAITDSLCRLLAPVLPHTADEAFRALRRVPREDTSVCVHLETFARRVGGQGSCAVRASDAWPRVLALRERAMRAIEAAKKELGVDNPLDTGLTLPDPDGVLAGFDPVDLADLMGVSRVACNAALAEPVVADLRAQPRCQRSWKRDATVAPRADGGVLSDRDWEAVQAAAAPRG